MNVLLHVEEIFPRIPIYHVAVGYEWGPLRKRFDYHPQKGWDIPVMGRTRSVRLGKTRKNLFEIYNFQKKLRDKRYILGFRDCRHYTQELLNYSQCPEKLDVVNMFKLHEYFSYPNP